MAVLTAILSPDRMSLSRYRRIIENSSERILPPSVQRQGLHSIAEHGHLLTAVHGRRENVQTREFSFLAGIAAEGRWSLDSSAWWKPGGPVPDGSFVLFRGSVDELEVATDYAGSRSAWHARLRCGGIAVSTSFELIIALLGEFVLDSRTLGWFLSSGSNGPRRTWSKQVKPLARNSCLRAKVAGDVVSVQSARIERETEPLPPYNAEKLRTDLQETLAEYQYGDGLWLLGLSGGYDSRAILHGTEHIKELKCITWIDEDAQRTGNTDVGVARRLADEAGREHEIKTIRRPESTQELEVALRRFMRFSDGRADNILGYVDGMAVWDELAAGEAVGLLRGDELFGSSIAIRASRIRHNMNLDCFHDFATNKVQRELAARYDHNVSGNLLRRPDESISQWRLRLRADYEIPVVYSALNNLRSRFVESCCPLLHRHLVEIARSIECRHLDERSMYTQAVAPMYAGIPFAEMRSTLDQQTFLCIPVVIESLLNHLQSDFARETLGSKCVQAAYVSIRERDRKCVSGAYTNGGGRVRGRVAPLWVKRLKRRMDPRLQLDLANLTLRNYLASLFLQEMDAVSRTGASMYEKGNEQAIA